MSEVKVIKVEFPDGLEKKIKAKKPAHMMMRQWFTHLMKEGLKRKK